MLFIAVAKFKAGAERKRAEIEDQFTPHLMQNVLRIRYAGRIIDPDGARKGIFMMIEASTRGQVDNFVASSPFAEAGLYESVEIEEVVLEVGG